MILSSCSTSTGTRTGLKSIDKPKGFDKTELGQEYSKLQKIYNEERLDLFKSQSYDVIQLAKKYENQSELYLSEVYNESALCLRVANMEFNGFNEFPNKDTILDLYMRAYKLINENDKKLTSTFAETVFQLADCLEQDNNFESAIKYRKEYYNLKKSIYGEENIQTADPLMWIGGNYEHQGQLDSALKYYRMEVKLRVANFTTKNKKAIESRLKTIKEIEEKLL